MNVRMPEERFSAVQERAAKSHMSVQDYVNGLIERDLSETRRLFLAAFESAAGDMRDEFELAFGTPEQQREQGSPGTRARGGDAG